MTKKSTAKKTRKQADPAAEILEAAIGACEERKAHNGLVLDLRELNDATDYFLIVSGTSDTHVRAIAEHVIETLQASKYGKPYSIEGLAQGRWVLIDYVDMVVHVFHPELRSFYQLEQLWGEAPRRRIDA
jgi:ribosome-associated protein